MKALTFFVAFFIVLSGQIFASDYFEIQRQKDIERALYWEKKGYNFSPNLMNAYQMDQQVKDIARAKYWKDKGYNFNPNLMNAYQMDQQVKDIARAKYWKDKGYNFNPNLMNAYQMDQQVENRKNGKPASIRIPAYSGGGGYRSYNYDVSGYSYEGDYVYGEIDVDQSGGDGYIYDEEGNEVHINVDWTGHGELEGYDSEGNYYDLEVD